jgi:hypothetical protein
VWRFYLLAVLLALSHALLAQPPQTATAPSTATTTQTATGSTGTSASPSDAKANLSWLHGPVENLKDIGFIVGGIAAVILAIVAAVLFTKRGRLMILGAVLDGLAADPASAKRLYDGVLQLEKTFGHILGGVLDGIAADQTRARRIFDCVISVDEDRTKIYDRVIQSEEGRWKITTAVIHRLRDDPNSSRQLLDLIVWEFGGNRSKDFTDLLEKRENQQILKAAHDIRAVTGTQSVAQKDDK